MVYAIKVLGYMRGQLMMDEPKGAKQRMKIERQVKEIDEAIELIKQELQHRNSKSSIHNDKEMGQYLDNIHPDQPISLFKSPGTHFKHLKKKPPQPEKPISPKKQELPKKPETPKKSKPSKITDPFHQRGTFNTLEGAFKIAYEKTKSN